MGRKTENSGFACANCRAIVDAIKKGTIRNHCPFCLYSLHVDIEIGDRQSDCGGLMAPIGMENHSQKGWQIVQKCTLCGHVRKNMMALDDDVDVVAKIMREASK